jgi:hypothetical protein
VNKCRRVWIYAAYRAFQPPHPAGIEPATIGLEDRCSIH